MSRQLCKNELVERNDFIYLFFYLLFTIVYLTIFINLFLRFKLFTMFREEGLLCGGSCGSVMVGALEAAKGLKEGQRCVGKCEY